MVSGGLPDEVDQAGLGPVEAVHRYSTVRLVLLFFAVLFLGPAVLLVAASLLKPVLLGGRPDPELFGSAVIFALLGSLPALGSWLARWPRRLVVVCRDGFVELRRGAVREVIRWDTLHGLSLGGKGPNRITYGPDHRSYAITQGGLRLAGRCARELTARGRPAPAVPPLWAFQCLITGIFLPWLLIAPGIALNHRATGAGLIVLIGGVPLVWGMIGLRHNVAQGGAFGGTGAARAANIGCLAVALAVVIILTVGLPLMVALEAR